MMYRNVWMDADMVGVASNLNGYYTATLPESGALAGASDAFGSGYLAFTLNRGAVKVGGKLADGTVLSLGSTLLVDDSNRTFTVLYSAPAAYKGGSLFGMAEFLKPAGTPVILRPWQGEPFVWESRDSKATETYGAGYVRDIGLVGGWYDKLGNLYAYYADKALEVGTGESVPAPEIIVWTNRYPSVWWNPDGLPLHVMTNQYGVLTGLAAPRAGMPVRTGTTYDYDDATNTVGLVFSLTRATGVFRGWFKAWFDYGIAHAYRNIGYEGVLTPEREDPADGIEGRGFFRWTDRSQYLNWLGRPSWYLFNWSHDFVIQSEE